MQEAQEEPDDQPSPGVFIGNDVVPSVGDPNAKEDRAKEGGLQCGVREAVVPERGSPYQTNQHFDHGVLQRDRVSAMTTFSAQQDPGNNRDIVTPADRVAALWALRPRPNQ